MKMLDSNDSPPVPGEEVDNVLGCLKEIGRFEEKLVNNKPDNVASKQTINAVIQVCRIRDIHFEKGLRISSLL